MSLTMTRGIAGDPPVRIDNIRVYSREKTEHKSTENQAVVHTSRPVSEPPGDSSEEVNEDSGTFVGGKSLLIGLSVTLPVIYLLIALAFDSVYFRIVGAVMNLEYRFRDWFSFTVWSRVPGVVFATLATLLAVLALGERSDSQDYQILAFAWWLPMLSEGSRSLKELIFRIDLVLVWVVILQTIGFREWADRGLLASLTVVAAPVIVLYGFGIWILT